MDIPVSKVLKIAQEPISLETPIVEEEESRLGDIIEDRSAVSPAENVINLNLKEQARALRKLRHPSRSHKLKAFLKGGRIGFSYGGSPLLERRPSRIGLLGAQVVALGGRRMVACCPRDDGASRPPATTPACPLGDARIPLTPATD